MWHAPTVSVAPAAEPVTADQARQWARVDEGDTAYDADLDVLVAAARAHVEQYTGTKLVTQTIQVLCDYFSDFARLPLGPVQSISSVAYVDTEGATQTLATSVYELIKLDPSGVEARIALKYGQSWPAQTPGSRITVTLVAGYATVPEDVTLALRMLISDRFHDRENPAAAGWHAVDSLLSNHRRGV